MTSRDRGPRRSASTYSSNNVDDVLVFRRGGTRRRIQRERERERETLVTYLDEFFGLAGGPVPVAVVQLEPGLGQLIGLQFQAPPGVLEAGARLVDAPFQLALLAADDFQLCGVCVCACVCVDRRD